MRFVRCAYVLAPPDQAWRHARNSWTPKGIYVQWDLMGKSPEHVVWTGPDTVNIFVPFDSLKGADLKVTQSGHVRLLARTFSHEFSRQQEYDTWSGGCIEFITKVGSWGAGRSLTHIQSSAGRRIASSPHLTFFFLRGRRTQKSNTYSSAGRRLWGPEMI